MSWPSTRRHARWRKRDLADLEESGYFEMADNCRERWKLEDAVRRHKNAVRVARLPRSPWSRYGELREKVKGGVNVSYDDFDGPYYPMTRCLEMHFGEHGQVDRSFSWVPA